jgi:hypothetical protein
MTIEEFYKKAKELGKENFEMRVDDEDRKKRFGDYQVRWDYAVWNERDEIVWL